MLIKPTTYFCALILGVYGTLPVSCLPGMFNLHFSDCRPLTDGYVQKETRITDLHNKVNELSLNNYCVVMAIPYERKMACKEPMQDENCTALNSNEYECTIVVRKPMSICSIGGQYEYTCYKSQITEAWGVTIDFWRRYTSTDLRDCIPEESDNDHEPPITTTPIDISVDMPEDDIDTPPTANTTTTIDTNTKAEEDQHDYDLEDPPWHEFVVTPHPSLEFQESKDRRIIFPKYFYVVLVLFVLMAITFKITLIILLVKYCKRRSEAGYHRQVDAIVAPQLNLKAAEAMGRQIPTDIK